MPIGDLFGLIRKRQTSPDKYLASSVNVVGTGLHGAKRPEFSQQQGISSFRSWVYAAASINANAVASVPLRLYSASGDRSLSTRTLSLKRKNYLFGDAAGDQRPSSSVLRKAAMYGDSMEEVTSHPVLNVLNSANPFLNGFDLSVLRVLYGELTGNAYLHPIIDESTGIPAELWPLAPQHVEVVPDEDCFLSGYVYGIDTQRKQVFTPDEIIHFRRPNPGSLYYGLGKVEAAFGVIAANEALHSMDLSMFQNSARPDYAVVVKGTPTGDQLDRFQQQVEERLRGTRKEGNFIAVTGDVQFTPLNFPPKDLAGREEIVEEIAAVFGVPVSMLKANDPNLASAQTGFASWRESTVLPLCRMDEQELNQTLLPMFGLDESYCLAYDNPVPSDQAFELQERQAAVSGGWRTPNEARLEEGREPIEDEFADKLLIGGQPIGGSPPAEGGFMSVEPETEPAAVPDIGQASATIGLMRERMLTPYSATKMLQTIGFSRAVAEKMVKAEEPPEEDKEKAVADVDLKPTTEMASLAERGLKLRKKHGRGGTEVGVARAVNIKNRDNLSPDTIGRMSSFFGRHRVDLDAPAASPSHDKYPSNGVIAWLLWGGDPNDPDGAGNGWSQRKMDELEAARDKEYEPALPEQEDKSAEQPKIYEWPEETKSARIQIEGLQSDFDHLSSKSSGEGNEPADENIRDGEKKTPAMRIESIVESTLKQVQARLLKALESGEIKSDGQKSLDPVLAKILKDLETLKGKTLEQLVKQMSEAARGGSKSGIDRINSNIPAAGKIPSPPLSKELLKGIEKRAGMIAESLIDQTLERFSEKPSMSLDKELKRLKSSGDFSKGRASTIARTESANAYLEGQTDSWKQSDMVIGKHFLVAPGACQFCKAVGNVYGPGKKSLPVDSPVLKSGQTLKGVDGGSMTVKLDSQGHVHPNCRCDMVAQIREL